MLAETEYKSYLLRLWRATSAGKLVWRASLEAPHTGLRYGFASLEQLFAFLKDQTGRAAEPGAALDPAGDQADDERSTNIQTGGAL
jgi:hypothetical protein